MEGYLIMRAMVISLFLFIFLVSLTTAIEFTIESPSSVEKDIEFNVKINSGETGEHDVKIFVYKDTKEFSEIFADDKWKSTHNYILSAFPSKKSFKLISYYAGNTKVCARLRESGKSSFKQVCNDIEIKEKTSANIQSDNEDENDEFEEDSDEERDKAEEEDEGEDEREEDENGEEEEKSEIVSNANSEANIQELSFSNNINYNNSKIVLTGKEDNVKGELGAKKNNKPIIILSLFTTFTIVIIILIALRKL